MRRAILLLSMMALGACSTRRIDERPILSNGERVPSTDGLVAAVQNQSAMDQARLQDRRDSLTAVALMGCAPAVCSAIARGEVALGMDETQVLAATRTTVEAWSTRRAAEAAVMVPAVIRSAPRDAAGELAMVQFRSGRVSTYSYRESHGIRVVDDAMDATAAGRAQAAAEALILEGDQLAARGDLNGALDRYDRASILRGGDAELEYRIATVLDKQLRPIEALLRYQLFLHRLELEKIEARGDAFAKLATAIAHARERIIVLERRDR